MNNNKKIPDAETRAKSVARLKEVCLMFDGLNMTLDEAVASAERDVCNNPHNIPSRKVLFNDPQLLKKYPHYPMIEESLNHSVLRPTSPYYPELSSILQSYLNQALASDQDPLIFMEAATKEMKKIMNYE